jgi:hypothetical protein
MAIRCSGPGPRHNAELIPEFGAVKPEFRLAKDKCPKHGRWVSCLYHAGSPPHCPKCRAEEAAEAEAAAEKECQATEERERFKTERERQLLIAEFQGQGHDRVAAEGLVTKRLFNKPRLESERRAEQRSNQKDFAAGISGICPSCKKFVPVFDGIILFHEELFDADKGGSPGWNWEPCPGEGKRTWPPGVRYPSQLRKTQCTG